METASTSLPANLGELATQARDFAGQLAAQTSGLREAAEDARRRSEELIRNQPRVALGVALGIGILVGIAVARR